MPADGQESRAKARRFNGAALTQSGRRGPVPIVWFARVRFNGAALTQSGRLPSTNHTAPCWPLQWGRSNPERKTSPPPPTAGPLSRFNGAALTQSGRPAPASTSAESRPGCFNGAALTQSGRQGNHGGTTCGPSTSFNGAALTQSGRREAAESDHAAISKASMGPL